MGAEQAAGARPVRARTLSRLIPPLTMALPVSIFCVAALTFPLTLARTFAVPGPAAAGWIAALYGVPALSSVLLTAWYRQPLLVAWSISGMALAATLAGHATYAEVCGASVVAGAIILVIGVFGLTERVARWIPTPIVMAMVAGAVLPYVAGMFTTAGTAPAVVGGAFIAYLLGRALLPPRVPAILPAVLVGLAAAALSGGFTGGRLVWSPPPMRPVPPVFTWTTVLALAPVLAVLVTASSNLAAVIYVRSQGYPASARAVDVITGLGTLAGSFFGYTPICMASFLTAPTAGPEAGERDVRHWSVYAAAATLLLIAGAATLAADLLRIVPIALLLGLAGLALIGVLAGTLQDALRGPLVLGPLLAFAVAISHLSYLGFGPLFWSLVVGTATSWVLERRHLGP